MSSYWTYTPYYNPPGQEPAVPVPFADAKDEYVRITGHEVNHTNQTVDMWVQWRMHPGGPLRTVRFAEFDVHTAKSQMVLNYWESLGGRNTATKLTKKHFQAIIDQCDIWYGVVYTGYKDTDDYVDRCAVKSDCPRLVRNWNEAKKTRE
ncbi:hypothetical protein NW768_010707 [Fusarium equiseti]|uniref:Uncharacterized protein n=1 Tax=Fusarium equiseti TaxID=61235 RepID=A0ABQ8R029_FUSEQ|nr:hypothetical protein NW768_010707 [Fusarium equiseti]